MKTLFENTRKIFEKVFVEDLGKDVKAYKHDIITITHLWFDFFDHCPSVNDALWYIGKITNI